MEKAKVYKVAANDSHEPLNACLSEQETGCWPIDIEPVVLESDYDELYAAYESLMSAFGKREIENTKLNGENNDLKNKVIDLTPENRIAMQGFAVLGFEDKDMDTAPWPCTIWDRLEEAQADVDSMNGHHKLHVYRIARITEMELIEP